MIIDRARSTTAQVVFVLGLVGRSAPLRRIELAFAGFNVVEWATWIALLVFAYGNGGTTEAGLVAVVQLVPAALFAPVGAILADRHRPGRVLFWGYVAQAVGVGATGAVVLAHAAPALVYAIMILPSTAITLTRPTLAVFAPALARRPEELTAINVVTSWTESVSVLMAPALAGIVLAVSGVGAVFLLMSIVVAVSAVLTWPYPGPTPAPRSDSEPRLRSLAAGLRVVRTEPYARMLVVVLCADFVALGALDVLYPELAIGVLERGASWAGYLNAAFGAGATVAILVTAGLVGKTRLVPSLLGGLLLYVTSFVVLALHPSSASALLLLALAGAGRVVFDVSTRTLLQRVAPTDVLARVFGLLEGLSMAGLAVGSLVVAGLVSLGGAELGLIGVGLLLPLAAIAAGRALLDVDAHATVPVVEINLLRALPLFALFPAAQVESLARSLQRVELHAGGNAFVQGEPGDRFYVIADGEIEVIRDGSFVARLGRADGFGEIALLDDVPRTATCRAARATTLYALERGDFLVAVTGNPRAHAVARRLSSDRAPATHIVR